MKILFTILLSGGFMILTSAQSINRQVIATAGNKQSNASYQLTSTIGEPVIGLKKTTVTIHQGFLTGTDNTTLSIKELIVNTDVKVYPNPFTDLVNINLKNNLQKVTATVYNITGKQVVQFKINTAMKPVNLTHLANGMYLIQLHFTETNTSKSFKILKK